jgi:cysteamine dioxygenase
VNVNASLADRKWDYHPYVADSPAACMEVYECPGFSIGIFLLKPHKCMPLHDHPGMHGIM